MKFLEWGDNPVLEGPRGLVDWKGICEQIDSLQRQFDELKLPINAEQLYYGCEPDKRDYGVLAVFHAADNALSDYGFEIVQFDTGSDFYSWQIVATSDVVDLEPVELDHQPEDVQ